ncbi:MAG TPA: ABC transporter ATP-binding protein [Steroidobacteraceae bacterium]|nr:ABC transporter ATP-binding protein [Steroidobacteraceae bacterium]
MAKISLTHVSVEIPVFDVSSASLRKVLLGSVGGQFNRTGSQVLVRALRDVSFEAHDGDRIGIIGRNGSGKTTLLRVLSDVYPPTAGSIEITGRVSPMFDATLGMSPDATGMENIRICGMLWGLSDEQIARGIDDVVAFTELGEYVNVPVRTYSTGMFLRLAFAIATLREPEILLLDEVIGVGDSAFFEKAYARLIGMVRQSRILVVASHGEKIIRDFCNKAMWLDGGTLKEFGDVDYVFAAYHKEIARGAAA